MLIDPVEMEPIAAMEHRRSYGWVVEERTAVDDDRPPNP